MRKNSNARQWEALNFSLIFALIFWSMTDAARVYCPGRTAWQPVTSHSWQSAQSMLLVTGCHDQTRQSNVSQRSAANRYSAPCCCKRLSNSRHFCAKTRSSPLGQLGGPTSPTCPHRIDPTLPSCSSRRYQTVSNDTHVYTSVPRYL